jgi:AraC-like DNA-binding protein
MTHLINCRCSKKDYFGKHEEIIQTTIDFIKGNYSQALSIDDIAGHVQLSKNYLIKLFKEFTHFTPYEYILSYRINEAKKLLRGTELNALTISGMVGFNDEGNFSRTFKNYTGVTPLQYREKF